MTTSEIIQFLLYPNFTGWLLSIKIVFLVFGTFFLGLIIFILIKSEWLKRLFLQDLKEFMTYRPYGMKKFVKEWEKIEKRLDTGLEAEAKLALIEADSLLNGVLKRMGYEGKSLGESLEKMTADTLSNLEEIRKVHKIRNNIIHDPTYRLNLEEAKRALTIYERALIDLEAL